MHRQHSPPDGMPKGPLWKNIAAWNLTESKQVKVNCMASGMIHGKADRVNLLTGRVSSQTPELAASALQYDSMT